MYQLTITDHVHSPANVVRREGVLLPEDQFSSQTSFMVLKHGKLDFEGRKNFLVSSLSHFLVGQAVSRRVLVLYFEGYLYIHVLYMLLFYLSRNYRINLQVIKRSTAQSARWLA